MPLGTATVFSNLVTLLVATDNTLTTANIWEAGHGAMDPWISKSLPQVAIVLDETPTDEWGITNQTAMVDADIYYAMEVDGPPTTLWSKLEAIYDALVSISYAPTGMQVIDVDPPKFGRDLPPNQSWAEKGATQRAGMVRAKILIGETQVA